MPVYRQPGVFTQDAPSRARCYNDLRNPKGPNAIAGCYSACNNLLSIASSWLEYIDRFGQLNPTAPATHEVYQDARKLVHLMAYYVHVPLDACLQLIRDAPGRYPRFRPGGDLDFAAMYEWILNAVSMIDRVICRKLNIQSITNQISNVGWNQTVTGVPAYGVVELLLRIVTDTVPAADVENLQQTFSQLALQPEVGAGMGGIPHIAFACMGIPPQQAAPPPQFVVTTSRDRWPDFTQIRIFIRNAHNRHINVLPFTVAAVTTIRTESVTIKIANTQGQMGKREGEELRTFHQGLIDNQAENMRFDHRHERGLPMSCPGFAITSRCMRCQVLFRYNDTFNNTMHDVEQSYLGKWNVVVNQDLDCAEAFAHFYCRQLPSHNQ